MTQEPIPEDIMQVAREARTAKREWDNQPWLHIYGQYAWHSRAEIRGTKAGLASLRDAISAAIESGHAEATVVASDGEGYRIDVVRKNTHAGMGNPEYIMELAYQAGKREFARIKEFKLHAIKTQQKPAT